jgi:PAS domain S-box-containing protein
MFRNIKISAKITGLVLLLAIISVVAISFFTYNLNLKTITERYNDNLAVTVDNRAALLNTEVDRISSTLKLLQTSDVLKNNLSGTAAPSPDAGMDMVDLMGGAPNDSTEIPSDPLSSYLQSLKDTYGFSLVLVTDNKGLIAASTESAFSKGNNFPSPEGSFFDHASQDVYFGPVKKEQNKYYAYVGAPVAGSVLVVKVDMAPVFASLTDSHGLGETGESIVAKQDETTKKIIILSPFRLDPGAAQKLLNPEDDAAQPILLALEGKSGTGYAKDYRNKDVLAAWRKVDKANWAILTKIDTAEINGQSSVLMRTFISAGVAIALAAIALSMVFARSLTQPLNTMRSTLDMVSKGVLPEKAENHSRDEFGMMSEKVDALVDMLKVNADFAQKVGEGKFDTQFAAASENDTLGLSLINMRDNLIENERRDKERNWIVRGVAEVGEILRLHDSIDDLGNDVIKFILDKIGAIQGAFYVVNDEGSEKLIEMRASYAFNRKKYLQKTFRFAQGLVGQAAVEQDTVLRTEIPDDYMSLTSGILGDQKPRCILVVPLITNEEVFGILEFAGFKKFDPSQVKFVQELSLILARTIFNIKVNERTRKLLAESQAMSTELSEKQEVLRQNAEEMQATQEELKRTNQRLEDQIEEVNRTQRRMQLLLENASEVITIYEEDGTIRYISPSVETILGYGQRELQGTKDVDKVHPDYHEAYRRLFAQLQEKPDEKVTVQYEYKTKEGQFVWIESTGTNNMSNQAIHGYIINSRDITERRRAEQEQRMRSKMQALSENSLDLITRIEQDSFSYINPMIEQFTGKKPEVYLNKKVRETDLNTAILDKWLSVVEQVNSSNDKVSTEMDFPTEDGQRIMQVNAIPEYDDADNIESVLVVSHDITERKLIELEIQNKNKKINDSINYAKRIQNAILPNTRLINKALPDSFILYKPRDVVSGDFPWFVQIKNDIFIAAVDCTGHGVPGALLSLIGYFLLNDIVRSRKITEPGKILDMLDEGVTQTLRQDQDDSATKDGMDIALCRINVETREVEYAGAHRPLYFMKGGVMDEIKGNKFPIGGGIFKNQTNFTTHKIQLGDGDSFYFSSDGFPDQFGGPEVRKFGPKKTREIVEKVHQMQMKDALQVFDQEWESWKGDHKQTDDVLLIGIKF